jgi:DNA uptake protein ComE-like DNA-binding protein
MAKKRKKRNRGQTLATMVELAGAAAGLVSLAYELMQRHQAGKQQTIPQRDGGEVSAEHPRPGTGDEECPGSLLDKAGATLGAAGDLINVNRATPEVLRALQPIGKKRAKRIVARRPFKDVKQLKRVLPKDVYRTIKHQLTV